MAPKTTARTTRPRRATQPMAAAPPPRKRRSLARWFFASTLLAVVATVCVAPQVIFCGPVRDRVLAHVLADLRGTVQVNSLSAGWFSPLAAREIVIADRSGKPVLRIENFAGEKGLLALLWDGKHLGKFQADGVRIEVEVDEHSSNLEEVFAAWLEKPSPGPFAAPAERVEAHARTESHIGLDVQLTQALVEIHDRTSGAVCQMAGLDARLHAPYGAAGALEAEAGCSVRMGQRQGPLAVKVSTTPMAQTGPAPASSGIITLDAEMLPLEPLQAIIARTMPGCKLRGEAQAHLSWQWGLDVQGVSRSTLDGQLTATNVELSGDALAGDTLRVERLKAPCQLEWRAGQMQIKSLGAVCELGEVNCVASITVPKSSEPLPSPALGWSALRGATVDLAGRLDAARLAAMLPKLCQLRDDVQLRSGEVTWQVRARGTSAATTWKADVATGPLVAARQGREVRWDQPLALSVVALQDQHGTTIQSIDGQSSFYKLSGSGTPENLQVTGTCDLARLAAEAGRFVDLAGLELAGQADGKLQLELTGATLGAAGEVRLSNLKCTSPQAEPWLETQLTLSVSAACKVDENGRMREVSRCQAMVSAGDDLLTVALRQPVALGTPGASYALELGMQGDAERWLRRAQPLVDLPSGSRISGQVEAHASATCSAELLSIENAQVTLEPLMMCTDQYCVSDPNCRLEAALEYSPKTGEARVRQVSLRSTSIALDLTDGAVDVDRPLATLRGKLAMSGDISRLTTWAIRPQGFQKVHFGGQFKGQGSIVAEGEQTTGRLELDIEDLNATTVLGQAWREEFLRISAHAVYDRKSDTLSIEQLETLGDVVQVRSTGQIGQPSCTPQLDLRGTLCYDLEKLTVLLRPYVGEGVSLSGQQKHDFSVCGPLAAPSTQVAAANPNTAPSPLVGQASLGWQSANICGFGIAAASLTGEVSGAALHLKPVELSVNGGRAMLAAEACFASLPGEVRLPGGPLLDHVQVSPETCRQVLAFIVPAVAGVTDASGRVSVNLDSALAMLNDPGAAELSGSLTLHDVTVGPGPLARELATLIREPLAIKPESQVSFRVVERRVYHQGLELGYPGFTVKTYGSVGFDGTLALMVEMPIPTEWLANNPAAASLKDQTIKVPVGGTVERPKIDAEALAKLTTQFAGQAVEEALRGTIGRKLEGLLGPK